MPKSFLPPPSQQSDPLRLQYAQPPESTQFPAFWPILRWGLLIWASAGIAGWAVQLLLSRPMRYSICDRGMIALIEVSGLSMVIVGAIAGGSDAISLRRRRSLLSWGSVLIMIAAVLDVPLGWYVSRWQSTSTGWLVHVLSRVQYIVVPAVILRTVRQANALSVASDPRYFGPAASGPMNTFARFPGAWFAVAQAPAMLGFLLFAAVASRMIASDPFGAIYGISILAATAGAIISAILSLVFRALPAYKARATAAAIFYAVYLIVGWIALAVAIANVASRPPRYYGPGGF